MPPPASTPAYVPPPSSANTQTNAPVYTGSTATHAETSYKGPTPVFATWQPGDALKNKKQSAQDRRKANQARAEQNKKARERVAKAAREQQTKQQRKQADEYNKQQKKAAEAQKKADEQYFKQMEAQEKALMKDREAQVKAQREAAKQREVIAKQESQLAAQRQQMERQRQAAEKAAQTVTPKDYPYADTPQQLPSDYPRGAAPPKLVTQRAKDLAKTWYFTNEDVANTQKRWGDGTREFTVSSADRLVLGEMARRGAELQKLKTQRSNLTDNQKKLMNAVLHSTQKEMENMKGEILSKYSTATSPSYDSEQYGEAVTNLAADWNRKMDEMATRVDLLQQLQEPARAPYAIMELQQRLTPEERTKFNLAFGEEVRRGLQPHADKMAVKESPGIFESMFASVFASPEAKQRGQQVREQAIESANVRDLGPDYKQWVEKHTAAPAPSPLPPEGWVAHPRYVEQQALQQKFDYPVFGDNLTTLETAVAPMTPQSSVSDLAAANIAEIQKQLRVNDPQIAASRERLSVPIETYQPFKFSLLDTEDSVAREYMAPTTPTANAVPGTPMTVLDKVPARTPSANDSSYGITDLISDTRSAVSATKMYSSPTSLLDVKNIGPGVMDLDQMKTYTPVPRGPAVTGLLLKAPKVPEINRRTAVPIDYAMRSAKTVIAPYLKQFAGDYVPKELQKEVDDSVDAATSWGSKMIVDTQAGDKYRALLHRYAFERGPIAETVGAAATRVGGSLVNVAQKVPGLTSVAPYATKTIRFLASQPVSMVGAAASGVVDYARTVSAAEDAKQAERDLAYQKQDYEQLRNERINTMTREEARLADRKKIMAGRIAMYQQFISDPNNYGDGEKRNIFYRAMDKIELMKEQQKLVDDALQNISQERLNDAQQYQAQGLKVQEAARKQAEADAIERMNLEASIYANYGGF